MIQLTLTYGSTTIDLNASGRVVKDGYFPEVSTDGQPVTDRVDVLVIGTTAELQASIAAINRAFTHARQHQTDPDGCWLNFAVNSTETAYRSRVLDGAIMHDGRLDARWRAGRAVLALAITRVPYWEGAEVTLPLTNPNGADVTTGLAVFGANDAVGTAPAKRHNYVEIAAASVTGDLPAPVKLILKNAYATTKIGRVWIGHNHTDPANALWNMEAEAAVGEAPGDSNSVASGGYMVEKTLSTDAVTDLLTWTLSAAQLSAAKGQFVHALVRFTDATNIRSIRFGLRLDWNVTTIWQSESVLPSNDLVLAIRDLVGFRLPPWLQSSGSLDAISLVLTGQRITAVSMDVDIDVLWLMPADSFRYLVCEGYGVAQNSRIVDDGISGELYRDDGTGAGKVGILSGYGDPIMLQPNKLQRLYFAMHSTLANNASILQTITVQAVYRPRRSSV